MLTDHPEHLRRRGARVHQRERPGRRDQYVADPGGVARVDRPEPAFPHGRVPGPHPDPFAEGIGHPAGDRGGCSRVAVQLGEPRFATEQPDPGGQLRMLGEVYAGVAADERAAAAASTGARA